MTCNTHTHVYTNITSHKQLHMHTHDQSCTLSSFQSFFGWHFPGLLSLHELFTPPLSLTESSTDLMGRECAIRQIVGQRQPSKEW